MNSGNIFFSRVWCRRFISSRNFSKTLYIFPSLFHFISPYITLHFRKKKKKELKSSAMTRKRTRFTFCTFCPVKNPKNVCFFLCGVTRRALSIIHRAAAASAASFQFPLSAFRLSHNTLQPKPPPTPCPNPTTP